MSDNQNKQLVSFSEICDLTSEALLAIRLISRSSQLSADEKVKLIERLSQESHFYPDVLKNAYSTEDKQNLNPNTLPNYEELKILIEDSKKQVLGNNNM